MCGIIGAIANRNVASILIAGLQRLEYRGYDSAGLAVIESGKIARLRRVGKVVELNKALTATPLPGHIGIAHTRWATHGAPTEANAHPHVSSDEIVVVHNGIIENYLELREQLQAQGYAFTSETDTEVVAHLIHSKLKGQNLAQAVKQAVLLLKGAYGLGVISRHEPEHIIAVRKGSPLIIGLGIEENFIASDHLALLPVTQEFIFLEEGDFVDLHADSINITDAQGNAVERESKTSQVSHTQTEKGEYRHYMLKEIYEQPSVLSNVLEGRISDDKVLLQSFGENAETLLQQVKRIQIVACGTSYHAGMVARYWLERYAELPCQVEIASEFRYRTNVVEDDTLFITLSQSGETADTLEALRKAKDSGYLTSLSICNVAESSLVRESDLCLITRAGPEVGVASTKAFTTQLLSLLLLTTAFTQIRGGETQALLNAMRQVPARVEASLTIADEIEKLSEAFANKNHTLFLGRGELYPIALEGALKLKEISYIHAEAYPAGELKHGPLALVDDDMPVVTIAPNNKMLEKLLSNLQEVKARGGELFVFADKSLDLAAATEARIIAVPEVDPIIAPIIFTIPMQLLAYYVAVIKGTDVDQPRNLAKSVTVE
jgi:glucosamine--fructose-6-phosphate aminotransferase (isomerizing)